MGSEKGKALAVAGVIALGGLAASVAFAAPAKKKAPPKKPAKKTPLAEPVALSVKYAKAFGIPASLPVTMIAVQSNNRRDVVNSKNPRGGAWGYGQVTLDTAKDLTKRFPEIARTYWPQWNGTGQGLLNADVNVAMTAYQLSLAWRKYQGKPDRWMVAALTYHQGSGAMDKLLVQGKGQLPAKLPPNATIVKARIDRERAKNSVVLKLLAQEKVANVSGVGDLMSDAQWVSEDAKLRAEMKTRLTSFPTEFNERTAADLLAQTISYGRKKKAEYGKYSILDALGVGYPVDTRAMEAHITALVKAESKWRNKIPLLSKNAFTYRKGKNKEWSEVYNQVVKTYVETAGLIGQRIVKGEAERDLQRDLNPVSKDNLLKVAIGVGAGLATFAVINSLGKKSA